MARGVRKTPATFEPVDRPVNQADRGPYAAHSAGRVQRPARFGGWPCSSMGFVHLHVVAAVDGGASTTTNTKDVHVNVSGKGP